jgi:hypothetical protein
MLGLYSELHLGYCTVYEGIRKLNIIDPESPWPYSRPMRDHRGVVEALHDLLNATVVCWSKWRVTLKQ